METLKPLVEFLEKISRLFERDFKPVNSLEDLFVETKELYEYIQRWILDQKSNNEALQQLIDAQLEELTAAYEGLSALFEINKIISSVEEPWMILSSVLKLLKNAVNFSTGAVLLRINDKQYLEYYGDKSAENIINELIQRYQQEENTIFVDVANDFGGHIAIPLKSEIGDYGIMVLSTYGSKKIFTAGDKKNCRGGYTTNSYSC
jgi:sigma-B regulation protein RsbU (phosphoserine phosphatase)